MNKFLYVRHFREFDGMKEPGQDGLQRYVFSADPQEVETRGFRGLLVVPRVPDGEVEAGRLTYEKFLVECLVHALSEFEQAMKPNLSRRDGAGPGLTEHALHEDLLLQLRSIIRALAYMVNSASWTGSGPYHDFDKYEINRRLEFAMALARL